MFTYESIVGLKDSPTFNEDMVCKYYNLDSDSLYEKWLNADLLKSDFHGSYMDYVNHKVKVIKKELKLKEILK